MLLTVVGVIIGTFIGVFYGVLLDYTFSRRASYRERQEIEVIHNATDWDFCGGRYISNAGVQACLVNIGHLE